jgi:hypothetical protein
MEMCLVIADTFAISIVFFEMLVLSLCTRNEIGERVAHTTSREYSCVDPSFEHFSESCIIVHYSIDFLERAWSFRQREIGAMF